MQRHPGRHDDHPPGRLTDHANLEIGERLYVTEATVKTHVNRILAKLQLRDRVQAVVFCYEVGLVEPGRRGSP